MCPNCGRVLRMTAKDLASVEDFVKFGDELMRCLQCVQPALRSTMLRTWYGDDEIIESAKTKKASIGEW